MLVVLVGQFGFDPRRRTATVHRLAWVDVASVFDHSADLIFHMPYPEHLKPITFPEAEASMAETSLTRVAEALAVDLEARPKRRETARTDWKGPHADDFDETFDSTLSELSEVRDSLIRLKGTIDDARQGIADENAARAIGRADLDEERAKEKAERAAEEEAASAGS